MLPRIVFAVVASIVTAVLGAVAVALPEGRLMQATALAALVTGMIAMLVIFLSAAEVLSRLFARPGDEAGEAGAPDTRSPNSPSRKRRAA